MTEVIERRSGPRRNVSALVRVRPAESGLARLERRCALSNLSSNSLYFLLESFTVRQPMRLALSLVTESYPSAIEREYLVEVVRQEPLFHGCWGVAAKLVENVRWRLQDGLLVPEASLLSRWPLVVPAHIDLYA